MRGGNGDDVRQTFGVHKRTLTTKMFVGGLLMALLGYIPFAGIAPTIAFTPAGPAAYAALLAFIYYALNDQLQDKVDRNVASFVRKIMGPRRDR